MKRPLGVTILAILAFIGGILGILGGVGALAVGGVATGATAAAAAHVSGTFLMGMGIVLLVVGVLDIVLGVGFWRLSPWAWTLGIALQIVGLVIAGVYVAQGSSIANQAVGIAINLAVLIYLFTPGVRKAFGRG
jgi:uncharacterized membrane protein (DUF2068 family)